MRNNVLRHVSGEFCSGLAVGYSKALSQLGYYCRWYQVLAMLQRRHAPVAQHREPSYQKQEGARYAAVR